MNSRLDQSRITSSAVRIKAETARAAVVWASEHFAGSYCLLASMQDAVLIDIAMTVDRSLPVVFLDNGYHFDETLETLRLIEDRYRIDVEVVGPSAPVESNIEPGRCCDQKPLLLAEALAGRSAWLSGIRRAETETRATADVVETDRRGLVKVNPLAQWTTADVAAYIGEHDVIVHPLITSGYRSVGCRPCTGMPVTGDARSGRWAGTERTECGLHR